MNRKIVAIALVLLVLAGALMGCGVRAPDGDPKPEPTPETSLPGEDQDAPVRPLAAPGSVGDEVFYYDVSEDFRQSLWSFTSRTSGAALAGLPHANSLYSPVSLYYALAMLEAGPTQASRSWYVDWAPLLNRLEPVRWLLLALSLAAAAWLMVGVRPRVPVFMQQREQ